MDLGLKGKVAIVTGGSVGIGTAIALNLASEGCDVAINYRRHDTEAKKVVEDITAMGRKGLAIKADVSSYVDAQAMVETVVKEFGQLDILVCNAGINWDGVIWKMTEEQWDQVIAVNLKGVFLCLQETGKYFLQKSKQGNKTPGAIVNISSDAGRRGTIGQINYGAAKTGVLGITMSAAREWSRQSIRVNSICFGIIETQMTETIRSDKFVDRYLAQIPMGRIASAAEVSKPVCFLLSEAASYVTGQHLSVNGGFHMGF